ncbi:13971_t:CDS:1, partial [Acaulospora morrowiae]
MNKKPEQPRKKRMHLTIKSKQEICQRKQTNPTFTIDQLSEKYGCERSTVSKILKTKDEWLSMQLTEHEAKKMTNRPAKFIQLETAL